MKKSLGWASAMGRSDSVNKLWGGCMVILAHLRVRLQGTVVRRVRAGLGGQAGLVREM